MTAKQWQTKIKKSLDQSGTETAQYEAVIKTLADILAQRDACYDRYVEDGAEPVVTHTNQGGNANTVKNPLLVLWCDLNSQALAYWRELGLTPSSFKKITGGKTQAPKESALMTALRKLEA